MNLMDFHLPELSEIVGGRGNNMFYKNMRTSRPECFLSVGRVEVPNKDNQKSMYLIDFGIAKVGYANRPYSYSNCGTNNYKAP